MRSCKSQKSIAGFSDSTRATTTRFIHYMVCTKKK